MKCLSYNRFFSTMANSARLKIVRILTINRALNVTEICQMLGEEQSKVSHNLRILSDCNILVSKRDGKRVRYSLNKKTIVPLMRLVDVHVRMNCNRECCGVSKNG